MRKEPILLTFNPIDGLHDFSLPIQDKSGKWPKNLGLSLNLDEQGPNNIEKERVFQILGSVFFKDDTDENILEYPCEKFVNERNIPGGFLIPSEYLRFYECRIAPIFARMLCENTRADVEYDPSIKSFSVVFYGPFGCCEFSVPQSDIED